MAEALAEDAGEREDELDWLEVEVDDALELRRELERRGLGDGLPIVPPTAERVAAMLDAGGGSPEELLAVIPPRLGRATPRALAANAVMAGCEPALFPIVVTAIRALARSEVNLAGVQTTTGPVAPLVIVHGEAVREQGFNCGHGVFGPGNAANATVGRAVRLVLLHVGGARPGRGSMTTQGQPGQFSFCIAENDAATPWESYPSSLGIDAASAITVFCANPPLHAQDHTSQDPVGILRTIAATLAVPGTNATWSGDAEAFVVLGPEHAATIARAGWSRRHVQSYLYERARLPRRALLRGGCAGMDSWPPWMKDDDDPDTLLPVIDHPELFRVLVAGGSGKHSCVVPSWGPTRSVTLPLET